MCSQAALHDPAGLEFASYAHASLTGEMDSLRYQFDSKPRTTVCAALVAHDDSITERQCFESSAYLDSLRQSCRNRDDLRSSKEHGLVDLGYEAL